MDDSICPKCGEPSGVGEECKSCGVIIAKYLDSLNKQKETIKYPCPNCGADTNGKKICRSCGVDVTRSAATSSSKVTLSGKTSKLSQCAVCGGQISISAEACPHCGEPITIKKLGAGKAQEKKGGISGGVGCFVIVIVIFFFIIAGKDAAQKASDPPKDIPTAAGAYYISQEFVKKQLKAPSTAEFPSSSDQDVSIAEVSKGTYKVRAYVDAQNTFGAKIRNRYVCVVKYEGNQKWILETIDVF